MARIDAETRRLIRERLKSMGVDSPRRSRGRRSNSTRLLPENAVRLFKPLAFSIPRATQSPNTEAGRHWSRKDRETQAWERDIRVALYVQRAVQPEDLQAGCKRRVMYRRYGMRRLDPTNLPGSFKRLEDALVRLGLLVDDSCTWVENSYQQFIDRQRPRVEVIIDEPWSRPPPPTK